MRNPSKSAFAPGHKRGGRPKGTKNKTLPAALKLQALTELGAEFVEALAKFLRSRVKSDRKFAIDQLRRMLPADQELTVNGDKPLCIVVPELPADEPATVANETG